MKKVGGHNTAVDMGEIVTPHFKSGIKSHC